MAKFISLSSGSNGNCYYIGDGRTGILVDAGIGFRTISQRLSAAGVDLSGIQAVLVTHDHIDHIRGLGTLVKRLSVPVYATSRLHEALSSHPAAGEDIAGARRVLRQGMEMDIRGVLCTSFDVPHDATQTLGYKIDFFGKRFGIMTDLGRVPSQALELCRDVDYLIIESNYDVDMLIRGRYTPELKARVMGDYGHLSNDAAASAVLRLWHPGLKAVLLCHLSQDNNTPDLAYSTVCRALESRGVNVPSDTVLKCLPRGEILTLNF